MSTGQARGLSLPKRQIPRYKLAVPLDLTVLRSGVPDNIRGRSLEIGEGGMGLFTDSQLLLGESVRVEFLLPHVSLPVRATAVVRYQRGGCFGLQFLRLPCEQRSIIRYWTRREGELLLGTKEPDVAQAGASLAEEVSKPAPAANFEHSENSRGRFRIRCILALVLVTAVAALLEWWQWEQGWTELEAQIPAQENVVAQPQLKVSAAAMAQRIKHEVTPVYPERARQEGVQGRVVLDAVVSADGAVTQVKFVSGPETLSQPAMDAVRWWRYQPYLVNGQPVTIETTIVVDFWLAS
jgi:TonB family protein